MQSLKFLKSRQEMEKLLRKGTMGYLGLSNSDDPYIVPLNYAYVEGRILLHCATEGKKLDFLNRNKRVCFTIARQFGEVRRHAEGNPCHMDSESVICYGKARIVDDLDERRKVLDTFNRCFQADEEEITLETAQKCCAVVIDVKKMTGRREQNQERTYWRYSFEKQEQP